MSHKKPPNGEQEATRLRELVEDLTVEQFIPGLRLMLSAVSFRLEHWSSSVQRHFLASRKDVEFALLNSVKSPRSQETYPLGIAKHVAINHPIGSWPTGRSPLDAANVCGHGCALPRRWCTLGISTADGGNIMIRRISTTCLCRPGDLRPSRDDLEVIGTFNPGAIAFGDEVILLVRVAERPRERRAGYTALPRWQSGLGVVVDWIADEDVARPDVRFIHRKSDDIVRLTFVSHLRVMRSRNGKSIDGEDVNRFEPQGKFEEFGVEDPRITRIGHTYWITYVAVSRHGPAAALASTKDFQTFTRHGVIFPVENKDVVLFPEAINGEYVALHRPVGKADPQT